MSTRLDTERDSGVFVCTIGSDEVEAAARAWLTWQFGRPWETATPQLQERFRDGARHILMAAALARSKRI